MPRGPPGWPRAAERARRELDLALLHIRSTVTSTSSPGLLPSPSLICLRRRGPIPTHADDAPPVGHSVEAGASPGCGHRRQGVRPLPGGHVHMRHPRRPLDRRPEADQARSSGAHARSRRFLPWVSNMTSASASSPLPTTSRTVPKPQRSCRTRSPGPIRAALHRRARAVGRGSLRRQSAARVSRPSP